MHHPFTSYHPETFNEDEMLRRATAFHREMSGRRSVRQFSDKKVSKEILEEIIMTASSAPSGANKQPWTFCLIENPAMKTKIKIAAEKEEFENYQHRMNEEWLTDLAPLGTDWQKPFLETAPWLIVVFKKPYDVDEGKKRQNYYVSESVGIACGFLLAAIRMAGLCALTHTPSPMDFLKVLLGRPENERPYLLIPVGYPAEHCSVPEIKKKDKEEVIVYY